MTVEEARASGYDVLSTSRDLVEPALRAAVETMPPAIARMAGYQMGWWDEHGRPIDASRGESLRPALACAATAAVGGTAESAVWRTRRPARCSAARAHLAPCSAAGPPAN